jgi:hypothetical protein
MRDPLGRIRPIAWALGTSSRGPKNASRGSCASSISISSFDGKLTFAGLGKPVAVATIPSRAPSSRLTVSSLSARAKYPREDERSSSPRWPTRHRGTVPRPRTCNTTWSTPRPCRWPGGEQRSIILIHINRLPRFTLDHFV